MILTSFTCLYIRSKLSRPGLFSLPRSPIYSLHRRHNSRWALERAKRTVERQFAAVGVLESMNITLAVAETLLPRYFAGAWDRFFIDLVGEIGEEKSGQFCWVREIVGHYGQGVSCSAPSSAAPNTPAADTKLYCIRRRPRPTPNSRPRTGYRQPQPGGESITALGASC